MYVGGKKVVGAYVGKDLVWPTKFVKERDFTKYTTTNLSQITADGLIYGGQIAITVGQGITVPYSSSVEQYARIFYECGDLIKNAKIITIENDFYLTRGIWAGGGHNGISKVSPSPADSNIISGAIATHSNGSYNGAGIFYEGNSVKSITQTMTTGDYHNKIEINLSTGTIIQTVSGVGSASLSYSLNSTQISNIRNNYNYIYCRIGYGQYVNHIMKTLKVTIE